MTDAALSARNEDALGIVLQFLTARTPDAWFNAAPDHLAELLIDHANCEKKAASTALSMMYRYVEHPALLRKMSSLAREELRHFEQVLKLMRSRDIVYAPLSASRYAQGLHKGVRKQEPGRLVDTLIVGALIEARSCERFARLAPSLGPELKAFYGSLLKSEARHFNDYLTLAKPLCDAQELDQRLAYFRDLEADLVLSPDAEFRFHSGPPGGVTGSA